MHVSADPWFAFYMFIGIVYGTFLLWNDVRAEHPGTKRCILLIAFLWIFVLPYLIFWRKIYQLPAILTTDEPKKV